MASKIDKEIAQRAKKIDGDFEHRSKKCDNFWRIFFKHPFLSSQLWYFCFFVLVFIKIGIGKI